jgi:hypothetical protein
MESRRETSPADALAALDDVRDARRRLAERVASPWWYRLGAGACTASLFVGVGLVTGRGADPDLEPFGTTMIVLGAIIGPGMLLWALRRATGVSIERYASGMGAWYAVVFGLFTVASVLQIIAGVAGALATAGVVAFVVTVDRERRIDALLRRRVQTGRAAAAGA